MQQTTVTAVVLVQLIVLLVLCIINIRKELPGLSIVGYLLSKDGSFSGGSAKNSKNNSSRRRTSTKIETSASGGDAKVANLGSVGSSPDASKPELSIPDFQIQKPLELSMSGDLESENLAPDLRKQTVESIETPVADQAPLSGSEARLHRFSAASMSESQASSSPLKKRDQENSKMTKSEVYGQFLAKVFNRLALYIGFFTMLMALDPNAEKQLFGKFGTVSMIFCIGCMSYTASAFWFFSWVKVYLEQNQIKGDNVNRIRILCFCLTVSLNWTFCLTLFILFNLQKTGYPLYIVLSCYVFHGMLSYFSFSVLSVFFTLKTVQALKQTMFKSKNETVIRNLYRKTFAANCIFGIIMFLQALPLISGNFRLLAIDGKLPPRLFIYPLAITIGLGFLLYFNWIKPRPKQSNVVVKMMDLGTNHKSNSQ